MTNQTFYFLLLFIYFLFFLFYFIRKCGSAKKEILGKNQFDEIHPRNFSGWGQLCGFYFLILFYFLSPTKLVEKTDPVLVITAFWQTGRTRFCSVTYLIILSSAPLPWSVCHTFLYVLLHFPWLKRKINFILL